MVGVDRRALVAAGGALLLSGCGRTSGGSPASKTDRGTQVEGDIEVLNGLLELEQQSHAFYAAQTRELFKRIAEHEAEHVRRLQAAVTDLGGTPAASDAPPAATNALEYAARVENTAVAAYLDAIPKLADPKLRSLAAGIVATEAEHLAAVQGAQNLTQATEAFVPGGRQL